MVNEHSIEKIREKKKKALFKIFVFIIIESICLNVYIIISATTGDFNWPIERLTSSTQGFVVQLIGLIAIISGIYIFIQIMAYIALFLTTPEEVGEF